MYFIIILYTHTKKEKFCSGMKQRRHYFGYLLPIAMKSHKKTRKKESSMFEGGGKLLYIAVSKIFSLMCKIKDKSTSL